MAPVPPESRGEMYNVCRADDVVPGLYFLNPYKEYLGNEDECNSLGPALFTEQDVLTLPFGSVWVSVIYGNICIALCSATTRKTQLTLNVNMEKISQRVLSH